MDIIDKIVLGLSVFSLLLILSSFVRGNFINNTNFNDYKSVLKLDKQLLVADWSFIIFLIGLFVYLVII